MTTVLLKIRKRKPVYQMTPPLMAAGVYGLFLVCFVLVVLRSGKGAGEKRHASGCKYFAAGARASHQDKNLQESYRAQRLRRRARDTSLQGPGRTWYVRALPHRGPSQCAAGSHEYSPHRTADESRRSSPLLKRKFSSAHGPRPPPQESLGAIGFGSSEVLMKPEKGAQLFLDR